MKLFIYIINRQGHSDPSKQAKDQPLTYDESCGSFAKFKAEILLISANIDLYESQMKRTSDQSDQMTNQSLTYDKSNRSFAEIQSADIDLYELQMKRTSDQTDRMTNQSLT